MEITDCDKSAVTVKIPYKIGGLPVTCIGEAAFSGCDLTSITIPNSVTSIEESTFYECKSLISIIIPYSVKSIEDKAFYRCESLESITILNPDCDIHSTGSTINNKYDSYTSFDISYYYGTICGYENSTAQEYAKKLGYKFLESGAAGDANGDGNVTALDASMIFSEYKSTYSGGTGSFTQDQKERCDMNGDNKITALDASKVFSIYKENYNKG